MKATKPEKHLLLPVRSSNIRNHIVNLPATRELRGGFCYIFPLFSYYKFAITCYYFVVRGFSSSACCFLFSIRCFSFSVCCFLSIVCRFSSAVFYFMSAFAYCTFAGCSFCFVCFRFSFITNTLFAGNLRKWKTFCFCKIKGIACLGKKKICKSEYFAFCVEVKVFYLGKL